MSEPLFRDMLISETTARSLARQFQDFELSLQPGDDRLYGRRDIRFARWLIATNKIKGE